jgi:hypothetical protein
MPQPHEEIHYLNENSHRKIHEEELRTMWLREKWRYEEEKVGYRKSTLDDYNNFKFKKDEYGNWKAEVDLLIDRQDNRWEVEKQKLPELKTFDEGQNRYAVIKDTSVKAIYSALVDQFGDAHVSNASGAKWVLPNDSKTMGNWKSLLESTASQVQRNAVDLANVVANSRSIASEEVGPKRGGSDFAVAQWQSSELYKALESLEKALETWDKKRRTDDFPDKAALKNAADACQKAFSEVCQKHALVYAASATVPFIKYQLLATIRSLAEKVASQLAFYAGRPSFTTMYERIGDVPKGSSEHGDVESKKLVGDPYWETKPEKVWEKRLGQQNKDLSNCNAKVHAELMQRFKELETRSAPAPVDMNQALAGWYKKCREEAATDPTEMHKVIGQIAFGLQKHIESVNYFLMKDDYKSVKGLEEIRLGYQRFFDGIAWQIQKEVGLCVDTLS